MYRHRGILCFLLARVPKRKQSLMIHDKYYNNEMQMFLGSYL